MVQATELTRTLAIFSLRPCFVVQTLFRSTKPDGTGNKNAFPSVTKDLLKFWGKM